MTLGRALDVIGLFLFVCLLGCGGKRPMTAHDISERDWVVVIESEEADCEEEE